VRNHARIAWKFERYAELETVPDVIMTSLPVPVIASAVTRYGRRHRVPVVVDVRDRWPDAMFELVPSWLRPFARLALRSMQHTVENTCAAATAITGLTEEYVEWGLRLAGRAAGAHDRVFPMGYSDTPPSDAERSRGYAFWQQHGLTRGSGKFVACFFGTFGRHFDLETVIAAARALRSTHPDAVFVLCGTGDRIEHYRHLAGDLSNVLFPGWVGEAEIWTLMRIASVGLAPYYSTPNFVTNVPNKPAEYMSAALPVVSSLSGVLERLLAEHECGLTYPVGDAAALAAILRRLHHDREYRARLSDNARSLFEKRFVAETVYGELITYLEGFASRRGGAPPIHVPNTNAMATDPGVTGAHARLV